MHQPKESLPVTIEDDGLSVRLIGWGETAVSFMQMPAGMDLAPALAGLPDDLCQCPHWGYVLEGTVHVRYTVGDEETVEAGDVFYWPPGHTVWFDKDTKFVEFSPEKEMREVVAHIQGPGRERTKLRGARMVPQRSSNSKQGPCRERTARPQTQTKRNPRRRPMSDTTIPAPEDFAFEELRSSLRGELVLPADEGYDEARAVYNAMIDKRPALIARCADVADVISAVNFARENDLLLAVRGGGHNGAGLGTCDDGLVVDLSHMKGVRVDPEKRTVRVGGGCVWGEVDHATHAFGLATPSGIISTTGVGGLTLGGGLGHLTRRCGLSIDNLLGVDVVLADGSFVTASGEKNEDLFWAVRGGGGNFGVVTSFLFRLHPIGTVIAGPTLWPLAQAPEVMRWYRDFITGAPEDLNGFFAFLTVPPGPPFPEELHLKKMCGVVWCYTGPEEEAEKVFAPIPEAGTPALHGVQAMPFPALQSAFDALYPPGHQWYWKADFITELSDEAIEQHVRFAEVPTMQSTMHLYPVDGAAHRVGKNETPWSYREANWGMVIAGVDPDPANEEIIVAWAREYWEAIHPHSAGGAYVNMMMEEGRDRVRASYRDNYEQLAAIKRKYDPENLFRINQNIKPTA